MQKRLTGPPKKNLHDNFTPFSIYCDVEQFKYSALYV